MRMRCLLLAIIRNAANLEVHVQGNYKKDNETLLKHFSDNKFMNGSILLIKLEKDTSQTKMTFRVSLFYEGEKEDGAKYWHLNHTDLNKIFFPITGHFNSSTIDTSHFFDCNMYIVRHGQGTHNVANFFSKHTHKDPHLTDVGQQQAARTGDFIRSKKLTFSHYFCSDLLRTRETFANLALAMELNNPFIKLIVLPCAHELGELQSDGKCDGKATWASENMMTCSKQATQDPTNLNCNHTFLEFGYKIEYDWDYYFYFYHDQTRNSSDKHKSRRHCSNYPLSIINLVFTYFVYKIMFPHTKTFFEERNRINSSPSPKTNSPHIYKTHLPLVTQKRAIKLPTGNYENVSPNKFYENVSPNNNPFLVEPKTKPSSSPRILPTKSKTPLNKNFNPFLAEPKTKSPHIYENMGIGRTAKQNKDNQLRLHAHLKRVSELPGNYENVNLRPEGIYKNILGFLTAEQNTNPYRNGKRITPYQQTLHGGKRKKKTRVRKTLKKRT